MYNQVHALNHLLLLLILLILPGLYHLITPKNRNPNATILISVGHTARAFIVV